jgi:hypothetical protein
LHTIVRVDRTGAPFGVAPFAGISSNVGTGISVKVHGLAVDYSYIVVVYTVDKYGNVSSAVRHSIAVS